MWNADDWFLLTDDQQWTSVCMFDEIAFDVQLQNQSVTWRFKNKNECQLTSTFSS